MYSRRKPRPVIRALDNFELEAECERLLSLLSQNSQPIEMALDVTPFIAARQIIQIIRRLERNGYAVEVECFDQIPGETQRVWRFTPKGSVRLFVTRCEHGPSEISEPPIQPLTPDQVRAFLEEKRCSELMTRKRRQIPHGLTKKERQREWWARNASAVNQHLKTLHRGMSVGEMQELSGTTPVPRRFVPGHIPSRTHTEDVAE